MVERQKWMELRYSIYQPAVRNYEWFVPPILQRSEVKMEPIPFCYTLENQQVEPKRHPNWKGKSFEPSTSMTLGFQKCWFSGVYHTCNFSNPLAVDCRMKQSQSWQVNEGANRGSFSEIGGGFKQVFVRSPFWEDESWDPWDWYIYPHLVDFY